MKSVGKNAEKKVSLLCIADRMLNGRADVKMICNSSKKVNIELPSDLQIPLLGIYSKAMKAKT